MKMKLLDSTLICLLAGVSPLAVAQDAAPATPAAGATPDAAAPAVDCEGDACVSGEGVLMRVRTRGERERVAPEDASSTGALAPDRRVTVAKLTPRGETYFSAMAAAHEGWLRDIMADVEPATVSTLLGEIGIVKASASNHLSAGPAD